ncbi:PPP1R11 family protein [Megaselia abdita]
MNRTRNSDIVASTSHTETTDQPDASQSQSEPVLKLKLTKSKSKLKEKDEKKVAWAEETVDNEHMGKKKSKCCCIYKKPTVFGESSSESEDECENCFGHPEMKHRNRKDNDKKDPDDSTNPQSTPVAN